MSKTIKIVLLIIAAMIIAFGVVYFFTGQNKISLNVFTKEKGVSSGVNENSNIFQSGEKVKELTPQDKEEQEKMKIIHLSSSFLERLGSYSNQSNFQNIEDLKSLMTEKMKAWAENFVKEEIKKRASQSYWGITTKTISADLKSVNLDKGKAEAVISTQRKETTNNQEKVYYQSGTLELVKESGIWKVVSVVWGK